MFRTRPALALALSAGYLLLQVAANLRFPDQHGLLLSLQLPVSALAAVLLWLAGRRTRMKGPLRLFWFYLASGSLCYFIAEAIWWMYTSVLRTEPPIPSVADYIWNLQGLLFLVGLCVLVFTKSGMINSIRYGFDTLLLMLLLGLVSWEFILSPNYDSLMSSGNWESIVSSLAYPISDFATTCTMIVLMAGNKTLLPSKVQACIISGFVVFVFADTGYFILMVKDSYQVGAWVDPMYSAGLFLFGMAGYLYQESAEHQGVRSIRRSGVWSASYLYPNLCSILLGILLIHHIGHMDGAIFGSFLAFLLLLIRQAMVTYENKALAAKIASVWEETEFKANHDALSLLPNRRYFEARLNDEIQRMSRLESAGDSDGAGGTGMFAVLFLDLNRFKVINDSLGHTVGDQLIRSVAERLNGLAGNDRFIARLGGDEYTVLMTDITGVQDIRAFMERIHKAFAVPFEAGHHTLTVTTSIGASLYPEHGRTATDLMKNADSAMYKAKASGSGAGCLFTADLEREYLLKAELERWLYQALEHRELLVYYQPQVRAKDGKVIGLEALIRWKSPRGFISPGDFIPLAEETGLITEIGEWVLRTSCEQAAEWLNEGKEPFSMSVNVSPRQLEHPAFVETVRHILDETGFPPYLLILEITESFAIRDDGDTVEKLIALKQMGVQLSMDDFGTGYSSLNHLQRFRVDGLKIAQSFISRITDIREQGIIVKAILAMACSLQLTVVAEGVETEEQYRLLKELGCDVIQGYYFYKPMPAEEAGQALDGRLAPASAS
ncbi:putative bifunctional diguanylate cyclase/phosphodiesterase [Gorillibacterium sp. sgz5001074]|uniref:putative bifunctional diguanylate cyclase/phosphodiesterase n=1 Tax=Gorillibacterium sp. sgz5001074 TaxID=3446695 RepID=UPI003F67D0CA